MSSTFYPTQIGTIVSGSNRDGRLIFGRDPNATWEAAAFGPGGRPGGLQQFQINLMSNSCAQLAYSTTPLVATILMDASSMYNVLMTNPYAPQTGFYFSMRELSVCEDGVEKKMMMLASQTYPTGV